MYSALVLSTIVYVLINLLIGFWKLRSTDYRSWIAGQKSFSSWWISISLVGSVVGGGMFFTVVQMSYEAGTAVLALPLSYIIGYFLLASAVSKVRRVLDEQGKLTLFELVQSRLGAGAAAGLVVAAMSLIYLGMYFFILAGQFTVLAHFYRAIFGVSERTAWVLSLGVAGLSTLIYSFLGGIKKDIMSDVFQVTLSSLGLLTVACFLCIAPWQTAELPAEYLSGRAYGLVFPVAVFLFFAPSFLARMDYWQRMIACRSSAEAKRALFWSLPLVIAAYLVLCALGVYVRVHAAGELPQGATIWGLNYLLPSWAFVVVVLALYAAVMSAADTMLSVCTVSAYQLVGPFSSRMKKHPLASLRLLSVACGLGAAFLVIRAPDIVDLFVGAFTSIVILSPALAWIIFGRRVSNWAVLVSLILGYGSFLVCFLPFPELRKHAFIIGALAAVLPIAGKMAWERLSRGGGPGERQGSSALDAG